MKVIILTPNREGVFTKELEDKLASAAQIVYVTEPQDLAGITDLYDDEEKILALDPDFIGWKFTKENIDAIKNLKAICLQTTSFGWIDTPHAASLGIPVTNLKGFSTEAVAEFSMTMTLGVARKLAIVIKDGFKQDFVKHQGTELKGKKVGVVGLGSIGTRYAEICAGMGMEVMYWSKNSKDDRFEYLELENLFSTCDVIFPSLADNDETKKLITNDLLSKMKSNAIFVSIAHKLYDHAHLLDMAQSGKIFGYGFEEENGTPTKYEGNVLALPAIAWATDGSMTKNGELWTESILEALKASYPTKIN